MFGREKQASPSFRKNHQRSILIACFLLFGVLIIARLLGFTTTVKQFIADKETDGYMRVLSVFYPLDPDGTKAFASLVTLLKSQTETASGQALIKTILTPLQTKTGSLFNLLDRFFPWHAEFFHEFSAFDKDIASLLGMEREQTYLIVLQNTAEKRPNGGFFGSFALMTFSQGKITKFQVSDSYHPSYNRPTTKILGPERFAQFLPERDIYFIGANKVGFTYHDGPHIKTLYEKSYPGKKIRGVIFLRTDMFERLLSGFTEQLRHRQYLNATVDIRKGTEHRGKKDTYLASLQEYLAQHRTDLLKAFWEQLPTLLQEHKINIYLENISGTMHTFLRRRGLTTRFEEQHAYFRDSNIVFNKLDGFITKHIRLLDMTGEERGNRTGDIVNLPNLAPGNLYIFEVTYTLNVPESYHAFIRGLNSTYGITLGPREEHILGVHHEWATRGNVYLPPNMTVLGIDGDITAQRTFTTPFSHNAAYETHIATNNQTNTVSIQVMIE